MLALGFAVLGAPLGVPLVVIAVVVACVAAVRRDLRHVLAHGWRVRSDADGPSGPGRRGEPTPPTPTEPSGSGIEVDWERFVADFWADVERERRRQPIHS